MNRPTLLEFPCDFPLKIMGPAAADFAQTIAAVVIKHAPDFDPVMERVDVHAVRPRRQHLVLHVAEEDHHACLTRRNDHRHGAQQDHHTQDEAHPLDDDEAGRQREPHLGLRPPGKHTDKQKQDCDQDHGFLRGEAGFTY